MKPYDSTVTIDIRALAAYRPVAGPVPPPPISPDAPQAPPPLTLRERARIASDRLRAMWARIRAFDAALMAVGTPAETETRTITVEVQRVVCPAWRRRRETVLALCLAVPLLALSMAFALSGAMTVHAATRTGPTQVAPRVTQYACATAHGVKACRVVGNNYGPCATHKAQCKPVGYCARIHYPNQDPHCKVLLPPQPKKGGK